MPACNFQETLFQESVSKLFSDELRGQPSTARQGGREISARYLVRQMLGLQHRHPKGVSACQITCLVTMGGAFYNPPNTALDIVGMSNPSRVSSSRLDESASECLRNRFHFRISQEH